VWDELRLGAGAEVRLRDTGAELLEDTIVRGLVSYRGEGWAAEGGLDAGVAATFSADVSAWLEPAVQLAEPLWARVRAWRLSYADAGAWVVAPGLSLDVGAWGLDARYYLGLDDGGGATHAALARARWTRGELTLELGGGGGTGADYLEVSRAATTTEGHWLGLAGLACSPSWRHALRATYTLRHETAAVALVRHEASLAWSARF
jgi:hypothetical protein